MNHLISIVARRYVVSMSLESRVDHISRDLGRDLKVFAEASSKGAVIKILEGRTVVGQLTAADVYLNPRELDDLFMEYSRAGLPQLTRRRASYTKSECLEDYVALKQSYPVIERLWAVGYARLDDDLRGQGLGKLMYQKLLALGVPHKAAFAPGICFGEETSPSALRVWNSLSRTYPGEGYVLWGGR